MGMNRADEARCAGKGGKQEKAKSAGGQKARPGGRKKGLALAC